MFLTKLKATGTNEGTNCEGGQESMELKEMEVTYQNTFMHKGWCCDTVG